jgi:CDP-glucose 4,6-dehydratase
MVTMFGNIYKGKKVLITGNTGFKGAWLSLWLKELGAEVFGISNDIPSNPSLFEITGLENHIKHTFEDIRNLEKLTKLIHNIQPEFLFHLAAQPIVKLSYDNPVDTMSSNIMGTAHVLEALRTGNFPCTGIMITSDKCYDNVEWEWGYKETDALGGKDPYSASKGAAEIVIKSYYESFFKSEDSKIRLCAVRAGNVIGGADWAANRLVPDMFRSWSNNETVTIRSPHATRPWQHVLEPLSGYLRCGELLHNNRRLNGIPFNFGPNANQDKTVLELLNEISLHWHAKQNDKLFDIVSNTTFHEAGLLKLNCDRALFYLNWKPTLHFNETVSFTANWYDAFYNSNTKDMLNYTIAQIKEYVAFAEKRGNEWAKH